MAVSCVSAPVLLYGSFHQGVLKTVDGVVSKLELSSLDKQKFLPQLSKVVDEAIFQRIGQFSEATRSLLRKGDEETFTLALFVMIAFYIGGDKKK